MVKKALSTLYDGTCTVTEHQKVKKSNGSTGFEDAVVLKDQPCRLSYKTKEENTSEETNASSMKQVITLILDPEVKIKPGSKITVTQYDGTTDYKASGKPAIYASHQEIILDLFEGWS